MHPYVHSATFQTRFAHSDRQSEARTARNRAMREEIDGRVESEEQSGADEHTDGSD